MNHRLEGRPATPLMFLMVISLWILSCFICFTMSTEVATTHSSVYQENSTQIEESSPSFSNSTTTTSPAEDIKPTRQQKPPDPESHAKESTIISDSSDKNDGRKLTLASSSLESRRNPLKSVADPPIESSLQSEPTQGFRSELTASLSESGTSSPGEVTPTPTSSAPTPDPPVTTTGTHHHHTGGSNSCFHHLNTTGGNHSHHHTHHSIHLIGWQWDELQTYIIVSLFLLVAALVKLSYHHTVLQHHVPESCILILLGTALELITKYVIHTEDMIIPAFSSKVFFFLLLPPIILESAYSLHDSIFFRNIGTILLYAIVGTLINIFLIGPALFLFSYVGAYGSIYVPFIECLVFSTLISAVDPVAVLAIFQEIGVNKSLYFLVFGESLLNDAVVITLYNSMKVFAAVDTVSPWQVLLGSVNFITVSGGGLLIGLIMGFITALITKFTQEVRVVEPMIVITIAYLSYVTSELFHFSGIIGIIGCGLMQIEYAKYNISQRSYVTIKYFTKNLSTVSDVIIFFFLGKVLVRETHMWNTQFVLIATTMCVLFRFVSVFSLTWVANNCFHRIHNINFEEQLVMAYGGLRGAIAFSLSITLDSSIKNSKLFVSATLFIILFTVFVQGSTTKTIVRLLRVKTEEKDDPKMFLFLHEKVTESLMTGIENLTGNVTYFHWISEVNRINENYLKRFLVRGWVSNTTDFTETFNKVKNKRPKSIITMMVKRGSAASSFSPTSAQATLSSAQLPAMSSSEPPSTSATSREKYVKQRVDSETPRWHLIKHAVNFTARAKRNSREEVTGFPGGAVDDPERGEGRKRMRSGSNVGRKHSLLNLIKLSSDGTMTNRDGSTNRDELDRIIDRRALNSALSRTSFYQLPGSIYVEDIEDDRRNRKSGFKFKATGPAAIIFGSVGSPKGQGTENGLANDRLLLQEDSWRETRRRSSVQEDVFLNRRTPERDRSSSGHRGSFPNPVSGRL